VLSRLYKFFAAFLLLWALGLGSANAVSWSAYTYTQSNPTWQFVIGDYSNVSDACYALRDGVGGCAATGSDSYGPWGRIYAHNSGYQTDDTWVFLRQTSYLNATPENEYCTVYPNDENCFPVCEDNQVNDPVTGECVCADGETCDDSGGSTEVCSDDSSCLDYVEQVCSSYGEQIMNYQYFGGGQYGYECGLMTNSCPSGQVWNAPTQVCINDGDSDGTPDPFDPDPTNPDIDGDSDSDGVPDDQDSHPNDPTQWNGSTLSGQPITIGQPQDPIGSTTDFDDTAIVSAINETIEQGNTSNSLLEDIQGTAAASNDLLNDGFTSLGDGLSETNGLLSGINETLQPVDGQQTIDTITGLMEQTSEELGIQELQESDTSFVSTGANVFKTAQCNNPVFDGHTIDLCSHASRIVPIAEFIIWLGTLLFIWNEVHRTLRRQS